MTIEQEIEGWAILCSRLREAPSSRVVIIFTPDGVGNNFFHDMYIAAKKANEIESHKEREN